MDFKFQLPYCKCMYPNCKEDVYQLEDFCISHVQNKNIVENVQEDIFKDISFDIPVMNWDEINIMIDEYNKLYKEKKFDKLDDIQSQKKIQKKISNITTANSKKDLNRKKYEQFLQSHKQYSDNTHTQVPVHKPVLANIADENNNPVQPSNQQLIYPFIEYPPTEKPTEIIPLHDFLNLCGGHFSMPPNNIIYPIKRISLFEDRLDTELCCEMLKSNEQCPIKPSYGYAYVGKSIVCYKHIKRGMIRFPSTRCAVINCLKPATYGRVDLAGKTAAMYCAKHKHNGYINYVHDICLKCYQIAILYDNNKCKKCVVYEKNKYAFSKIHRFNFKK